MIRSKFTNRRNEIVRPKTTNKTESSNGGSVIIDATRTKQTPKVTTTKPKIVFEEVGQRRIGLQILPGDHANNVITADIAQLWMLTVE